MEVGRNLGIQVPAFPENRHSAHEERTAAQIGGVYVEAVWILTIGSMYPLRQAGAPSSDKQTDSGGFDSDRNSY